MRIYKVDDNLYKILKKLPKLAQMENIYFFLSLGDVDIGFCEKIDGKFVNFQYYDSQTGIPIIESLHEFLKVSTFIEDTIDIILEA